MWQYFQCALKDHFNYKCACVLFLIVHTLKHHNGKNKLNHDSAMKKRKCALQTRAQISTDSRHTWCTAVDWIWPLGGRIKENTIRGEISRCFPLFVCFHYLSGKSKITFYMAKHTEYFKLFISLLCFLMAKRQCSLWKWIHLHAHGVQEWKRKFLCWCELKLKSICDTKSYSALNP